MFSINYIQPITSLKKGKSVVMLSASKELGSIKLKRKKSFKVFDPSNEEVKKERREESIKKVRQIRRLQTG